MYYSHPDDTTKYFMCIAGNPIELNCKENFDWNQEKKMCIEKQPECVGNEFLAHQSDCNKYYICISGFPIVMDCPKATYWNSSESSCDPDVNLCK